MSTETHAAEFAERALKARIGVLLLICGDLLLILSGSVAGLGYARALDVSGQFRPAAEDPAIVPGLVGVIVTLVSVLPYYWGTRGARAGDRGRVITGTTVALLVVVAAFVIQIWAMHGLTLAQPVHAYGSFVMLLMGWHAVQLVLVSLFGLVLVGRTARGRLAGHEYVAEVTGYYWYWVALSGVVMWLAPAVLR